MGTDGDFQGREGDQRDCSEGKGEGHGEGYSSVCWETSWTQLRARSSIPAVLSWKGSRSNGSLTSCSCSATLLQLKHPRKAALLRKTTLTWQGRSRLPPAR